MLNIGHRGAPRAVPENTIASFQKAMELGANGVELDVHLSKDGEVVVIHDETVNRTTNGCGKVADMTLAELRALSIKGGGTIPTLAEVIDALGKDAIIFIEIKSPDCGNKVIEIVRGYITQGWRRENLWIISFNHEVMGAIKKQAPELLTSATTEKMPPTLAQFASDANADAVTPCISYLTPDFVADARKRSLKVFVWTANSNEEIKKAHALGVDGIMTDDLGMLG